jgi:hypothetical protein
MMKWIIPILLLLSLGCGRVAEYNCRVRGEKEDLSITITILKW